MSKAQPTTWGKNAGCSFISTKCAALGVPVSSARFFCDPIAPGQTCTHNYSGFGYCNLKISGSMDGCSSVEVSTLDLICRSTGAKLDCRLFCACVRIEERVCRQAGPRRAQTLLDSWHVDTVCAVQNHESLKLICLWHVARSSHKDNGLSLIGKARHACA